MTHVGKFAVDFFTLLVQSEISVRCSDTVGWVTGRASGL